MNEDIKIALVNYITGQADETESAEVREWIKRTPANEAYYFEMYEAWHAGLYLDKDLIDVEAAYSSFLEKTIRRKTIYSRLNPVLRIAAAAVIIMICALVFYNIQSNKPAENLVELKVPHGGAKRIALPDGSTVWVNAGSEITYPEDFGKTSRTVYLVGEAYFDIAETDTEVPFIVKAENFTIRDVGTIFNVKAYPEEDVFETTVVEGKVSVEGKLTSGSDEESKVFLDANQVLKINMAEVTSNSGKATAGMEPIKVVQIPDSEIERYNGWKDDFLVFEGETFEEITRILERRYDVKIVFENEKLKNFRYTGTFKNIENISNVLHVIQENTPLSYEAEGRLITIKTNKPINVN